LVATCPLCIPFFTTGVHKTAREEHAGRLFVIRDLKVRGVPASAFGG
jgi:hypothetical protein